MTQYSDKNTLKVDTILANFIDHEVLPELNISAADFWQSMATVIDDMAPINQQLLKKRESLQANLDQWLTKNREQFNHLKYVSYLKEIGYLVEEGEKFSIDTANVDDEIALQAGPQLVVPTSNARFALNATNARWGSLYDALYGTDVIPETGGAEKSGGYNPVRGQKVIAYGRDFLDANFPLEQGSHRDVTAYTIEGGHLKVSFSDATSGLKDTAQWVGFNGLAETPTQILLRNNGLHVIIEIDAESAIGKTDQAGVKDLTFEAAVTTIQDFEDSVAAVDGEDKVGVYRNWLGLMRGDLSDSFEKGGQQVTRVAAPDKTFSTASGETITLPGRSLLFCRNVGHLMTNPAILYQGDQEVPEGIMDAMISVLISMHDLRDLGQLSNSRTGSIYIVKPKMHGPEEVAFANSLFNRVEDELGLPRHTIKIGVMDEERRTTVNLKECIRQVKGRIVFINTGFLDRTGDEIHTSMLLGPMAPKADIKTMPWIKAYEDWNVDMGLECGFTGKAQIGKGMWAMPDEMAKMMAIKSEHPEAGANCAWVPSPNGATLHAMHYHQINVFDVQAELKKRERADINDILRIPLCQDPSALTAEQIQHELDNNAQGILGYVVRWIDQGVGCSKVPDINNVGLMEDRATLRISSQHICNWLEHGICDAEQVKDTFKRMAKVVDEQNAGDSAYTNMSDDLSNSTAYQAALDLVFKGKEQPSGYTEPLLHAYRLKLKAKK
ncbi:malate synthase G [Marinicella sp. S1101]|uniref:malate synthase G n=1 Tax=Marinicella marina TaxID=2996016 RepID=UPI002260818F|nr:malate synthase G [Marinicella marina]MCX7553373.1 malate synthase G [Marinicella marina]MDJ1139105.1 malate synthase G [Marinicella marina]